MNYALNFREVIYALSEALDLVGIDDIQHGKRVAFMASECAKETGFDGTFVDEIIALGMLHDCGVSTTDVHRQLVTQLEWKDEQAHCVRGAALLEKTTLLRRYAPVIFYHHTHWDELENLALDARSKQQANLIYLVDRVDALRTQIEGPDLEKREEIERIISEHAGSFFSPELVGSFIAASHRNSFWFNLEVTPLEDTLLEWVAQGEEQTLPFSVIREVAQMFADIVDAKSPFTFEHSFGVAAVSVFLARALGLDEATVETVEIGALLHDLGKLRVHDAILNKNGMLEHAEKMEMHRHGFDSNMILHRIKGFKQIALIASLHHETLDGKGYPYSLEAEAIPLEARIVTVADIFQALVQDRPYREAMGAEQAYAVLEEMAADGKIDGAAVALIGEHLPEAYRLAKSKERA
jgi:putative nucleotidyltransferase with HDIG domain